MSIMRFLLPLVLVLATCWAGDPIFEEVQPLTFDHIPTGYRLPNSGVEPINYDISLQPYFETAPKGKEKFSFDGTVKITLKRDTTTKTNSITLHAADLTIIEATLQYEIIGEPYLIQENPKGNPKENPKENPKPDPKLKELKATIKYDKERDFIILSFEEDIPSSVETENYYLTLNYTGTLKHEDLYGFYRSSYGEGKNKEWLATTQFEPVSARRAFPCWDEPAIKATFDITIKHPSDYTAISNMQQKKSEKDDDDDDLLVTQFERTNKMSTYLVAFVVSKFEEESNEDEDLSVWAKPDSDSTEFALENGKEILSALESYTDFKYYKGKKENEKSMGMLKMDQVSIPQFPAGAMENWGLVTYKEPLLFCTNVTTTRAMQDTKTVIAHEFAHQWFGNLVTPEWWNYIWLNEGFATFFQYFTPDSMEDDKDISWRLMDQFVVNVMQESAFMTDASILTRPMNQDAATRDQIQSLFDNIAYKKAACVIRMMQHFMTEDIFTKGLRLYLENNKYKSVSPKALFEAMEKAKTKKVELPDKIENIMENWIGKPGYPVINVTINNKNEATITQERFFLSKPSSTDKTKWTIPINYITESEPKIDTKATDWFESKSKDLKIKKIDSSKWVIFNNLQTGYYRVKYDDSNWKRLAAYLDTDNFNKLNPVTRAQLIDDSLNLARAGYISYDIALPMTLYLYRETDYIPWYAALRTFDFLYNNLQGMSNYEDLQKYIVQKLNKYIDMVELTDTPKNSTHFFQLGREMVLEASCKYGSDKCNKYTLERLKKWFSDKQRLPTDLRDGILCAGVRQADQATWNTTLEMYKNSTDSSEKVAILNALGCVRNRKVIETFLQLSLEDESVIDFFEALKTIFKNNYASFDVLVDFIFENIEEIRKKDADKSKLTEHVNQLATRIFNKEQYGKLALLVIREYIRPDNKFDGMIKANENLDWIEKNQEVISKWLKDNYKAPKPGGNSATSITSMSFLMVISVLVARFY